MFVILCFFSRCVRVCVRALKTTSAMAFVIDLSLHLPTSLPDGSFPDGFLHNPDF
jgi:hypothetical protein